MRLTVAPDHRVPWLAASAGPAVRETGWREAMVREVRGDSAGEQQAQHLLLSVFRSLRRTGCWAQLLDRTMCMRRWQLVATPELPQLTTPVEHSLKVGFRIAGRSGHRTWRAIDIRDNSAFGTSASGRNRTEAARMSALKHEKRSR